MGEVEGEMIESTEPPEIGDQPLRKNPLSKLLTEMIAMVNYLLLKWKIVIINTHFTEAKPPGNRGFDSEPYRDRPSYDRDSSSRFERNDRAFSSDRDFDRGSSGGGGGGFERRGFGGDRDRAGGFDTYDRNRGGRDAGGGGNSTFNI